MEKVWVSLAFLSTLMESINRSALPSSYRVKNQTMESLTNILRNYLVSVRKTNTGNDKR